VATAVIQGDLTRSISVEARGEVLGLKDTINQMSQSLGTDPQTTGNAVQAALPMLLGAMAHPAVDELAGVGHLRTGLGALLYALFQVVKGERSHGAPP
jgi:uncharacterized protein YidB (DUF937 family)